MDSVSWNSESGGQPIRRTSCPIVRNIMFVLISRLWSRVIAYTSHNHLMIGMSQRPTKTTRIGSDGNYFFRYCIDSNRVTGSQAPCHNVHDTVHNSSN